MSAADAAALQAEWSAPAAVPVPASISDRQFAQQLAVGGTISEAEALACAARGELPAALEAEIETLPQSERFAARMLLSAARTYERAHPLVATLGTAMGYDSSEIDEFWRPPPCSDDRRRQAYER